MKITRQSEVELDSRGLHEWELFKLAFVHVTDAVAVPDTANLLQKWLIRYANTFTKSASLSTRMIVHLVALLTGLVAGFYAFEPEFYSLLGNWTRFLPICIWLSGILVLYYFSTKFWLRAGGAEMIVGAYNNRVAKSGVMSPRIDS